MSANQLDDLVARLARVITVTQGRRGGDDETRIHIDHLLPSPGIDGRPEARWRIRTLAGRLVPAPAQPAVMAQWHAADGGKGRRLAAVDLEAGELVALLSWHFEPRRGSGRPHLVTSAAVCGRGQHTPEALDPLRVLFAGALAIDSLTTRRGEVGLVRDSAVQIDLAELARIGFVKGPARTGYAGDYWVLRRASR